MIALDASVLIAHLDTTDDLHSAATDLLEQSVADTLGVSPITLAEVFAGPARAGQLEAARAAIGRLGVQTIPIEPDAPARLAVLRAETSLKLPDCCVVLAAEQAGGELATFDKRLAGAATQLGLVVRS